MKPNLDTLRTEIPQYLVANEFTVFHGYSRLMDSLPIVLWDCDRYPDFQVFLRTAKSADVRFVVYHEREFTLDHIDEALSRLEEAALPRERSRALEMQLRELRIYEGFTCALELSFDYQGRIYLFDLRTDWYEDLSDIVDEIESSMPDSGDGGESLDSYFSKN